MTPRVVIVGGGFGGLAAAQSFSRAKVLVTLIDRRNFHLFQPLLYQVATGGLSPANIAMPLRSILRRQKNVQVVLGEVTAVDPDRRRVLLVDDEIPYDWLILAAGARHHYFGKDRFESLAPGLKTIEDATAIRGRILTAFEAAERHSDPSTMDQWLTFIIVGGGPTGVEMAGAVGELAHHTLRHDFRRIDTRTARILLVEGRDRILPMYPQRLSRRAEVSLKRLGVTVRCNTLLENITNDSVSLQTSGEIETVSTRNVIWAAGVQASPLGTLVARSTGAETDQAGRLVVQSDCRLPGHPNIFVIGDLAHFSADGSAPLPGVAPVAVGQGRFVAEAILRSMKGQPPREFLYRDRGQMATIGRAAAVADVGNLRFGGFAAWLAWLFIHLILLVGFQNRLLVLLQWCWNYVTRKRSARLITHGDAALIERPLDDAKDQTDEQTRNRSN